MKRLSFISFVLSAFLLIGFVACEPINPEVPSVDSGGTSSDSTSVDNGSGGTSTDTTNPDNDAPNPEDFEYVDLGLSVKWATMNVGADAPEGYGDFYDYDEAVSRFGNNLPTKEQLQELEDKCTWEWATRNEVNGWEVTGPNGKSIFLPAAGLRGCDGGVCYVGMAGFYWSSALSDSNSDCAWYLELSQPLVVCIFARFRCDGLSVRLVQDNADSTNPDDDIEESGYVDLGLSVKWAAANVGADLPEGYGDFYGFDEAVSEFGNCMPTEDQFEELKDKCTWEWITYKGINGWKVTGPNGKRIFLPAAGYHDCNENVDYVGKYGYYWSSTPDKIYNAWNLFFTSDQVSIYNYNRCSGLSVRLVQGLDVIYTIIFNANGGSGTMSALSVKEEGASQKLTANSFTRSGYTFTGWNTKADGSGTSYTNGQTITPTANFTLYAQWKEATSGTTAGHDWVDLGLSVKWATTNVGASNPEECGTYYTYGEAQERLWTSPWRTPTKPEWEELKNECTWTRTTQNGVEGQKVTGPNGKSIFLPAAGIRGCDGNLFSRSDVGYYWSSTPYYSDYAWCLEWFWDDEILMGDNLRCLGLPVRLVLD